MNTSIEWSDTKLEITKALFAAQGEILKKSIKKSSDNPYFHSKYADLGTVFDVALPALREQNVLLVQGATSRESSVEIETSLVHVPSGEFVRSVLSLTPAKSDPQGVGSAITYGRRYGLQPLLSIAPEDDDGNAASGVANGGVKEFKPFTKAKANAALSNLMSEEERQHKEALTAQLKASVNALGAQEFNGVLESVQQNTDDNQVVWTSGFMDKKRFYTKDPVLGNEMLRFGDCDCTVTATRGTKANDFRLVSIK